MKIVDDPIEYRSRLEAWVNEGNEGDWIGVFENKDFNSPMLGYRFALFFDAHVWELAEVGRSAAPDTPIGLGWRYLLVAKTRSVDEALEALNAA